MLSDVEQVIVVGDGRGREDVRLTAVGAEQGDGEGFAHFIFLRLRTRS